MQAAEGVPAVAARRKGGRLQPLPLPRKPPGTRYYHSRSCISMTREEAEASVDSDDEPDTEAWRVRALPSHLPVVHCLPHLARCGVTE